MTATITGAATSASCYTASVDFAQFDYLAVHVNTSGGSAVDLIVEIDLF
jgi:hypothetical protein